MPSKKKKKKQDFQKVKLKVGRKLPRPANETRTQFKVRGINIKSQFQSEHSAASAGTDLSAANVKVSSILCLPAFSKYVYFSIIVFIYFLHGFI